jgi:glycosyltransferase involved in cell wall biosynthesis
MRIGITCYPTYGGSGAVATELGLELARRGHEIHLISYASPFRLRGFAEHVYFHEVDLSGTYPLLEYFPYSLALAVKQEEVALRERLDILHVHYAVPHAAGGDDAPRNRHHPRWAGTLVLHGHQVLDRAVKRSDRGVALSAGRDV